MANYYEKMCYPPVCDKIHLESSGIVLHHTYVMPPELSVDTAPLVWELERVLHRNSERLEPLFALSSCRAPPLDACGMNNDMSLCREDTATGATPNIPQYWQRVDTRTTVDMCVLHVI